MKINKLFLFTVLSILAGCTKDFEESVSTVESETEKSFKRKGVITNTVCIKLDRETADALSITRTRSGELETGNLTFDEICERYEVVDMERIFPADHCEERMRKAGLDLWYCITLGADKTNIELAKELSTTEGVQIVTPERKIKRVDTPQVRYATQADIDRLGHSDGTTRASSQLPFNDPLLSEQWMLINDGSVYAQAKAGADINVKDAWGMCAGSNEVIVAVVDGGIQYDHPDLKDNMWSGIGRNFTTISSGSTKVTADEHGTHVAGTIGAVSNNGTGISGIAGGSGNGNGVKIMSCQIFEGDAYATDRGTANAITFAANNGAVICQNSWGEDYTYTSTETSWSSGSPLTKAAIDYFITNAGMSSDGTVQTGPMAGGVVIFAAGNDGKDQTEYPAAYSKCISVAALSCNFQRAWYSTYSTTVDLCAPGGDGWNSTTRDEDYKIWNLSTLPTTIKNGDRDSEGYVIDYVRTSGYGWMRGTSMACPHVSGVAALIVSYCGGTGFTAEKLKEIMFNSARDINSYQSSTYRNKIGKLVDATAALRLGGQGTITPPEPDAPVISPLAGQSGNFSILDYEKKTLKYTLSNYTSYSISDPKIAVTKSGDEITLVVDGSKYSGGSFTAELTAVNDSKSTTAKITFTVTPNEAPKPVEDAIDTTVYLNETDKTFTYDLTGWFTDANGDITAYGCTSGNPKVIAASVTGSQLSVKASKEGEALITVTARDGGGKTAEINFIVRVNTTSLIADFYPNPCTDKLNIRLGEISGVPMHGNGSVTMRNAIGVTVFDQAVEFVQNKPLTLNVGGLNAGRYSVVVKCAVNGKIMMTTQTVIKK